MADPRLERRLLFLSAGACLLIGIVGLSVSLVADSQAILLDGAFNLIFFVTGLLTIKIAGLVQRPDDVILMNRGEKRAGSPLVSADAQNWIVNGAISTAVILAFAGVLLLERSPLEHWAPFVDPVVVIVLVLISISVPIRMGWQALNELLGRTPSLDMVEEARGIVQSQLSDLPVKDLYIRLTRLGRFHFVMAHVVLPEDFTVGSLDRLDQVREAAQNALRDQEPAAFLEMAFTSSPTWGKPVGLIQEDQAD